MSYKTKVKSERFHGHLDTELAFDAGSVVETKGAKYFIIQEREVSYRFYPHQHPYVQQLVQRLLRKSTAGLQAADTEYVKKADGSIEALPDGKSKPVLYADIFSATRYNPSVLVEKPYPVKDLDFTASGAYSSYN